MDHLCYIVDVKSSLSQRKGKVELKTVPSSDLQVEARQTGSSLLCQGGLVSDPYLVRLLESPVRLLESPSRWPLAGPRASARTIFESNATLLPPLHLFLALKSLGSQFMTYDSVGSVHAILRLSCEHVSKVCTIILRLQEGRCITRSDNLPL